MPYSSRAQQRLFHALEARGEMSPQTVSEWDDATKGKKIPDRVKKEAAYAGVRAAWYDAGLAKHGAAPGIGGANAFAANKSMSPTPPRPQTLGTPTKPIEIPKPQTTGHQQVASNAHDVMSANSMSAPGERLKNSPIGG